MGLASSSGTRTDITFTKIMPARRAPIRNTSKGTTGQDIFNTSNTRIRRGSSGAACYEDELFCGVSKRELHNQLTSEYITISSTNGQDLKALLKASLLRKKISTSR